MRPLKKYIKKRYVRAKARLQTVSMLAERSAINPFQASIANSLTDAMQREHIFFSQRSNYGSIFLYDLIFYDILTLIFFSYNICSLHGDIAQLVEHTAHIRDVIGPIPIIPTKNPVQIEQDFFLLQFFSCKILL